MRSGWGAEVGLNVKWDERIIISNNWIMNGVGIRLAPAGLDGAILSYSFLTTLKVRCCYGRRSWLTRPAWHGVTIGTVYANLYASHAERSSAFAGSEMKHIKMCLWWWWLYASSCRHWMKFTGAGNNGTQEQEPVVSWFISLFKTYVDCCTILLITFHVHNHHVTFKAVTLGIAHCLACTTWNYASATYLW